MLSWCQAREFAWLNLVPNTPANKHHFTYTEHGAVPLSGSAVRNTNQVVGQAPRHCSIEVFPVASGVGFLKLNRIYLRLCV